MYKTNAKKTEIREGNYLWILGPRGNMVVSSLGFIFVSYTSDFEPNKIATQECQNAQKGKTKTWKDFQSQKTRKDSNS